jgi:hypothetical protein
MKRDKHSRPTPDQPHRDIPDRRFWNAVDRENFELALASDDKYTSFLAALHDPNYSRCSFPALLRKFNISLHEAQTLYTDHMRHMGLLAMSSQLPAAYRCLPPQAWGHIPAPPVMFRLTWSMRTAVAVQPVQPVQLPYRFVLWRLPPLQFPNPAVSCCLEQE